MFFKNREVKRALKIAFYPRKEGSKQGKNAEG
jgi:hypothetical protein